MKPQPIKQVILTVEQWNLIQEKMQRMEEALSFYANEDNYKFKINAPVRNIDSDYGKRANVALGLDND